MEEVIRYIRECINPRDETEFLVSDVFNVDAFFAMKQDGIMVTTKKPPTDVAYLEYVKVGNVYMCRKCFYERAWLQQNTQVWNTTRDPIYRRLIPPPAETVDHPFIIEQILKASDAQNKTYIEYGVSTGNSLFRVSPYVRCAHGVDVNPIGNIPANVSFHQMTTKKFSEEVLPRIEFHFAFIDADHSFVSSCSDFQAIYQYISPGGIIFLHDTYPCEKEFLKPYLCNDCYRTPIYIKEHYNSIENITLPLHPGLTLIRKPLPNE